MAISGRLVIFVAVGSLAVILYPHASTILWWLLLSVMVMTIDLLAAAPLRRVEVERGLPANVRLGEWCESTLTITNRGRRTIRAAVREGWQPSAGANGLPSRLTIPPAETRRVRSVLRPVRRGDLHVHHVTLRSFGPLGLASRQLTMRMPATLRVLPAFHSKRHLPSKLRKLRELNGSAAVQLRGAGTEFDSLRDYVRGDDVRSIDWRATARRRETVVRTWRPERDRRVIIVLDTSRTSAVRIQDEPRLDTGIEASLLLAVLARHGGDRVDFLAFDRRLRARVESEAKGNQLSELVNAMAPLEPELIEADWTGVPRQIHQVSSHRSLVVLLTSLDAGAVEEGLLPVLPSLTTKHMVVVAAVRDPELDLRRTQRNTAAETYRAAAAERALLDRAAVAARIRQTGAEIVDETPHDLAPRLADMYIRLKAAGRL
ncbi:DUF58 domain-containing protein [Arthrobacter roseus]|uniref:DUF58 domain-containing protein n=1 Tax=Arthrobacter roseus TaxID=136274 RepID=UPI001966339A|nr:DUF58 domain-containing protein [Arthrobacter roseus]MBM7849119.1 uncharacterized protein (DUF58 family) [Arthrobacter roseus]